MTTTSDIEDLLSNIRACRACAHEFPHTPRPVVWIFPETRLLICGQAPGRRVNESGRPFTDPSGDRLRDWMGIDETTFYGDRRLGVAPQAFCYPGTKPKGGDYPPPPRCAALWREKLFATLPRQKLILMVGSYSINWFLKDRAKESMTETVRAWREYGPQLMPLPHPSWRVTGWMKRNPWFETDVLPHLRERVAQILG
ncbi:uracil-DNA glycosylase family protein [Brevundimonas sp.]|uniref:uracil-DNA glycosylase family protein n=1 Tax=Brevundimonas sp. TaxID=1871086 RepID=UPI002898E4A9|nr:uracil-DNA glycosylase family protein [Brevundimonas sp.]